MNGREVLLGSCYACVKYIGWGGKIGRDVDAGLGSYEFMHREPIVRTMRFGPGLQGPVYYNWV